MEHFLKVNQRGAGRPARTAVHLDSAEGARLSQLIVLAVERVKLQGEAAERWGDEAFESFIQLKTGRTHQVRQAAGSIRFSDFHNHRFCTYSMFWNILTRRIRKHPIQAPVRVVQLVLHSLILISLISDRRSIKAQASSSA